MVPLSELIKGAQAGDSASVELLVNRFTPLIETECRRFRLFQHPDWSHSDLFQEVCLQLWTKIGQFQGVEHGQTTVVFEQWLRKTAHSVLTNTLRHQTAKKRMPEGGHRPLEDAARNPARDHHRERTASSVIAGQEEAQRIQAAMENHLDEQTRQILKLRIVEGLSMREIAARLSLTYDQTRYRFQIGIAELENRLA